MINFEFIGRIVIGSAVGSVIGSAVFCIISSAIKKTRLEEELETDGSNNQALPVEKARLEGELKIAKSNIEKYKKEQAMFVEFNSLNEDAKKTLKGIFKLDSFENFIACGSQRSNIDAIWVVIKNRIHANQFDDIEKLNNILKYFIEVFNKTTNTPTIKLQDVPIGEKFNPDYFIRSADSKPAGNITEIYLIGYDNAINGNNINKSLVRVEG